MSCLLFNLQEELMRKNFEDKARNLQQKIIIITFCASKTTNNNKKRTKSKPPKRKFKINPNWQKEFNAKALQQEFDEKDWIN